MHMLSDFRDSHADTFGRHTPAAGQLWDRAPEPETALFREVIQSTPAPILVMEAGAADQPIVYANPAFEVVLGYDREEVIGRDWRLFLSMLGSEGGAQSPQPCVRSGSITEETLGAIRKDGTLVYFKTRLAPVCDDAGAIVRYVAVLHDVTCEHRMRATLEYRACYDPLTGLANRYLLRDRFEHATAQAQRHGNIYAVTLLDVDGFKEVNDRFGHAAGDEVLAFLGARLTNLVRREDTVARLGGDEFVLLLMDAKPRSTQRIMRRLRQDLASFGPSGLEPLGLSCSAGVARFPGDGTTLERLLEVADRRLYAAKA